jgi:DNA polymerase-3 subunit delta'
MSTDVPEPDRVDGALHPRDTERLVGQDEAEHLFCAALGSGRFHHAWLLTGPRGIGKATLAWRAARYLIAQGDRPPRDRPRLDVQADHAVARRMRAGSEPALFVLRRGLNQRGDALSSEIRVEEVRKLSTFLQLSSADGGRRAIIVDAAEEMNTEAANAVLKLLEEPPPRTTFLMVSHRPLSLLPTIRSRCRELRLRPLSEQDIAAVLNANGIDPGAPGTLSELACGSAGDAIRLAMADGPKTYAALVGVARSMPRFDRAAAIAVADGLPARAADEGVDVAYGLLEMLAMRLARTGAEGRPPPEAVAGEAALLARLAADPEAGRLWSEFAAETQDRLRHGRAVNLDPGTLLLDTLVRMNDLAGRALRP